MSELFYKIRAMVVCIGFNLISSFILLLVLALVNTFCKVSFKEDIVYVEKETLSVDLMLVCEYTMIAGYVFAVLYAILSWINFINSLSLKNHCTFSRLCYVSAFLCGSLLSSSLILGALSAHWFGGTVVMNKKRIVSECCVALSYLFCSGSGRILSYSMYEELELIETYFDYLWIYTFDDEETFLSF